MIGKKFIDGKTLTDQDLVWLIHELQDAYHYLDYYDQNLGNWGHIVELTEIGWGVEHTPGCGGVPNRNTLHMRMEREGDFRF